MIGTGIEAYIALGGEGGQITPKEYFLGYITGTDTLQDLLDSYNLTVVSGQLPVLSVAVWNDVTGDFIIKKYLTQLSSGGTYAPLGNYASEKTLILIDTLYPNEQTAEAAINAVNAVVLPDFSINALAELIPYLNASVVPINVSEDDKIYYFKFNIGTVNYIYVLSSEAERGIYGTGFLQFTASDLVKFINSDTTINDYPSGIFTSKYGIMQTGDISLFPEDTTQKEFLSYSHTQGGINNQRHRVSGDSFNFSIGKNHQRSRGTRANPTATLDGDYISTYSFGMHDGSNWRNAGRFRGVVKSNTTPTDLAFGFLFETTRPGTTGYYNSLEINGDVTTVHGRLVVDNAPVNPTDAVRLQELEAAILGAFKVAGSWDASVGTFPITGTGPGNIIVSGNVYKTSAAGTIGDLSLDIGDNFYAVFDEPGQVPTNWAKFEYNTEQASETLRGTARIATTEKVEEGADDLDFITSLKLANKLSGHVPFSNASFDLDLGERNLSANSIEANEVVATDIIGNVLSALSKISIKNGATTNFGEIFANLLTASRIYQLPNESGTLLIGTDYPPALYNKTPIWGGTSAPTVIASSYWDAGKEGKYINLTIRVIYTNPGTALTVVELPFPSGAPVPTPVPGLDNNNDVIAVGTAIFMASTSNASPASRAYMRKLATGYSIYAVGNSGDFLGVTVDVRYRVV